MSLLILLLIYAVGSGLTFLIESEFFYDCDLHRRQWQRVALWPIALGKRVAEWFSKAYAAVLYTFTNWRKVLKEL